MASIDLYTKQQIDAKIPDTSGASSGDVLTFNGSNNVWAAISAGGLSKITFDTWAELKTYILAHSDAVIIARGAYSGNTRFNGPLQIETASDSVTLKAITISVTSSSTKINSFSIGSFPSNNTTVSGRFAEITIHYDGSATDFSSSGLLVDFALSDVYAIN